MLTLVAVGGGDVVVVAVVVVVVAVAVADGVGAHEAGEDRAVGHDDADDADY